MPLKTRDGSRIDVEFVSNVSQAVMGRSFNASTSASAPEEAAAAEE